MLPSNPQKSKLSFTTYGVGTPRYKSFLPITQTELILGLGPNLILWDLKTQSNRFLAVTQSVIMVILPLELEKGLVVTVSYNGQIAIVDLRNWQVVNEYRAQGSAIREASYFNGNLMVMAEDYKEMKGLTEIFDVWAGSSKKALPGRLRFGELLDETTLFTLRKNLLTENEKSEALKSNKDIEIKTSSKGKQFKKKLFNYFMELHDLRLEKPELNPVKKTHLPDVCEIIASAFNPKRELIAFLYSNRKVLVVNPWKLAIVFAVKVAGSGAIMSLAFSSASHDELIVCPKADTLLKMDCSIMAKEQPPEILVLEEIKPNCGFRLEKYKNSEAFSSGNYLGFFTYNLDKSPFSYITYNTEGLHVYNCQSGKTNSLQISYITHCGVALNPEETLMATGDFVGNVLIFSTTYLGSEPIYLNNFGAAIRSLVFGPSSPPYLMVGCMDGNIYKWNYTDMASNPEIVSPGISGSITSLNIIRSNEDDLLLASSTGGFIGIYIREAKSDNFLMIENFQAHVSQDHHDKESFGSLEIYAEVWSNCWNPRSSVNSLLFASCSEDQSCKIWELSHGKPKELAILKGHTLAVTCVDWQETELGLLLATCSDDRTFRIYDWKEESKSVELRSEVRIDFVKEWFTLTYMALEKGGSRIACGAQNGFLFVFDLKTGEFEFAERVHLGSIEGLRWGEKGRLVTCAADLTVQVTEIPRKRD